MANCSCKLDTEALQPEEVRERCYAKFLFDRLGIRIVMSSLLERSVNLYNFFRYYGLLSFILQLAKNQFLLHSQIFILLMALVLLMNQF